MLGVLARMQGRVDDPETGEAPGKVVHEWRPHAPERFTYLGWPVRDGELRYYGSADGTAWFLTVLVATGDGALARELEPAWRAAGEWLHRALGEGRGFVRSGHRPGVRGGLAQQGWRDTVDPLPASSHGAGILAANGTLPPAPLADADTQAATLVGLRALARLSGDEVDARAAATLADRIDAAFGDAETMAVDADDRPVTGAGSQLGWLCWAGALSAEATSRAAERLSEPDLLTAYGLRTLAASDPRFAPEHYHRGSVWPFDSWIGWGGLRAAGRPEAAERVRAGVLAGLERLGGYPELWAVPADGAATAEGDVAGPARIPIANRVQAWTVGAAFALAHGHDGRLRG